MNVNLKIVSCATVSLLLAAGCMSEQERRERAAQEKARQEQAERDARDRRERLARESKERAERLAKAQEERTKREKEESFRINLPRNADGTTRMRKMFGFAGCLKTGCHHA